LPISTARSVAFDILQLVDSGGYASDLLFSRSTALDSRDAGLTSEIVFGVLRFQSQLDYLIERYSGRPATRLDPEVRIALRMGIYQLRYLERVPAHAAIDQSVELVKRARKRSAAGFTNAVLRKVDRNPIAWPSREIELAHPAWLLDRWDRQFGPDVATGIALANLRRPETYLRLPAGASPASDLEPTPIPGCFRALSSDTHGFRIQDIGSQSIVPLLDLAPGMTFLDLCAAPGNKTAQALESEVRAIACDFHWSRLEPLKSLGIDLVTLDARRPLPFRRRFDRILVDAPCTGPERWLEILRSNGASLHRASKRCVKLRCCSYSRQGKRSRREASWSIPPALSNARKMKAWSALWRFARCEGFPAATLGMAFSRLC
jgi:16S rRNA (cytosine967-C5)-methyltransferase